MLWLFDDVKDIPPDKTFIQDVEAWAQYPKEDSPEISFILKDVEQGSFYSERYFTDRFGGQLYWDYLSTGSKAAISAYLMRDWVVSFVEAGDNVLECMVSNNINASIYLPGMEWIEVLPVYDVPCKMYYMNRTFDNVRQLIKWWRYDR